MLLCYSMKKRNDFVQAALLSSGLAFILLLFTYYYWNRSYTYGYGDDIIARAAMIKDLTVEDDYDGSNVVPVNVAYDKVLIPHVDERDGTVAGVKAITDRGKMLSFLKMLKDRDMYEYVVCDVNFDDYQTEYDDELFRTIASMRDIVVASNNPAEVSEIIREKTVRAYYKVRKVGDDFMKYEYLYPDGEPGMALRIWEDITGGELKERWWGYTMNGKICVRSIVPDFRYSIYDDITDAYERSVKNVNVYTSRIYNLGAHVVEPYEKGLTSGKFFDGKIILIGDLTDQDIHDTIVGAQSGTVIIFNAFLALLNGDNIIPFWVYLLLFVVFWLESMFLFRHKFGLKISSLKIVRRIRVCCLRKLSLKGRNRLNGFLGILLDFVSYSTPLVLVALFIYAVCGIFVNAIIIGVIFFTISLFV